MEEPHTYGTAGRQVSHFHFTHEAIELKMQKLEEYRTCEREWRRCATR